MYITIDIGGTNIRVAVFDSLKQERYHSVNKFKTLNNYELDIKNIKSSIHELVGESNIQGIGIAVTGVVSEQKDMLLVSGSLTDWVKNPLKKDLESEFQCEVLIENDAAAAAIGEAMYGAGKGKDFVFIIWGTGVGGTAVYQRSGEIFVYPFEPGHQILNWHGSKCFCGQNGCAELGAGGDVIEFFHKPVELLDDYEWGEVFQYFAHLIANIIVIRPTHLMIFGGGIALNNPDRLRRVQNILSKRITVAPIPEMVITSLGDDTALFGGLALLAHNSTVIVP